MAPGEGPLDHRRGTVVEEKGSRRLIAIFSNLTSPR